MNLRTRFAMGYLLVALVTGGLGLWSLNTFGKMEGEYSLLQEDVVPAAVSLLETEAAVNSLLLEVEEFANAGGEGHREQILKEMTFIRENTTEHTEHAIQLGQEEGQAAQRIQVQADLVSRLSQRALDRAGVQAGVRADLENTLEQMSRGIEELASILKERVDESSIELAQLEQVAAALQAGHA